MCIRDRVCDLTQSSDVAAYHYSWDSENGVFTAYVPDSTAFVLVAKYPVLDTASTQLGGVWVSNSVTLGFDTTTFGAVENVAATISETEGNTNTGHNLVLTKRDASQYSLTLSGAEFKLEQYDADTGWVAASGGGIKATLTTVDGKASTPLSVNVLYRLTETKAPEGYLLDDTPYYFAVRETGAVISVPDGVSAGDIHYYDVQTGENTAIARVELDRFNAKDKNAVKSGELRVNKQWADASGKRITDPVALAEMPEVTVTLRQQKPNTGHSLFIRPNSSTEPTAVVTGIHDGAHVKFSGGHWDRTDLMLGEGVSVTTEGGYYKIGPICGDIVITHHDLFYWYGTPSGQEGGTPPSGTVETLVGSVTLNPANDWTYLWQNLEISENITYTLLETAVDGYETTYQLNGDNLTAGAPISLGDSGDRVNVTNSVAGAYELPETGGIGTQAYTLGGFTMAAGAVLWLCYRRKRRREDG